MVHCLAGSIAHASDECLLCSGLLPRFNLRGRWWILLRDTGVGRELDISLVMLSNLRFEAVWLVGSHITLALAHTFQVGGEFFFFCHAQHSLVGQGLLITAASRSQSGISLGKTSLDEWSARRRDLYLTTHNIHNRQTSLPRRIRTYTLSKREAADPHLRLRGSRHRPKKLILLNTLRTGLLNCLNVRSRGLNFRHRASCI